MHLWDVPAYMLACFFGFTTAARLAAKRVGDVRFPTPTPAGTS